MKPILIAAGLFLLCWPAGRAQSLDDLDIQIHGNATQALIYTNHNSWNTTDSENGSAAWTEAVVNLSAHPESRLRIAVQARYFLLGDYGHQVVLDWAQADFKVNERFGIRFGKVKSPLGLFNEVQDIDMAQTWVLLPQSVYPIASRNSTLSHYGGVAYGSVALGENIGKLEYRAFGGQRILVADDGYFQPLRDEGMTLPNGISGKTTGGSIRFMPKKVRGLMVGASEASGKFSGETVLGPLSGSVDAKQARDSWYFAKYDRGRWMFAAEYSRLQANLLFAWTGFPSNTVYSDQRPWYAMATYKATEKLTGGVYYASVIDHQAALTPSRYQKDWAVAARYDFTPYFYAKAEQHWIDGAQTGFAGSDNPDMHPDTRMSLLKLGVSF